MLSLQLSLCEWGVAQAIEFTVAKWMTWGRHSIPGKVAQHKESYWNVSQQFKHCLQQRTQLSVWNVTLETTERILTIKTLMLTLPEAHCRTGLEVANIFICFFCPVRSQGGQRLSWRHTARVGHRDGPVFTRPHGPRGSGALCPVRRAAGGQWCLRLHGQSLGPRDGDLPAHAAGPHQQSLLITGEEPHSAVFKAQSSNLKC